MIIAIATADSAALTPIEKSEIDINSIEYQFNANEHSNHVTTGYETKDADEEEKCTEHEETLYWYHLFVLLLIT